MEMISKEEFIKIREERISYNFVNALLNSSNDVMALLHNSGFHMNESIMVLERTIELMKEIEEEKEIKND